MPALSFDGVLVIALVAVAVPVLLGLAPRLPVPGAVLEVLAGILIGPSVLGWVHLDAPVRVLSDLGLGMLLFLAGLEIDVDGLRGPLGRLASWAFGGSVLLGVACGYVLSLVGVHARPMFLAVVLVSTAAGLLLPLLKDAGLHRARFGQLVMAAAALAELIPVIMLSLLFSTTSTTSEARFGSLLALLALLAVIGLALGRVRNMAALDRLLDRLEDHSGQLRVRAALTLSLAFAWLAGRFGFASILGAFAAGLLVKTIDLTNRAPHPQFQVKLEGIGFGFLVPVFFITTGVQFDVRALVHHPAALAEIPLFLLALLMVRAVPALAYVRLMGRRRAAAAGLMQATTLTFVIVATQIGTASGQISRSSGAALLAAGLLSATLFPALAVKLLPAEAPAARPQPEDRPLRAAHLESIHTEHLPAPVVRSLQPTAPPARTTGIQQFRRVARRRPFYPRSPRLSLGSGRGQPAPMRVDVTSCQQEQARCVIDTITSTPSMTIATSDARSRRPAHYPRRDPFPGRGGADDRAAGHAAAGRRSRPMFPDPAPCSGERASARNGPGRHTLTARAG